MHHPTRVAVVILNWNGRALLEQYLPKVIQYSTEAEIIIADNASSDDSISFLQAQYLGLRIIQNPTNAGFAEGYNMALRQVEADYYILLNSDVEVTEGWIAPMLELAVQHPDLGACQPKDLDYSLRHSFEYAGASGGFIDKYGYPFCRGRLFATLEEDKGQYEDAREIFWATGAAMFVKASAFWEAGGFDGDYFAHMEEIDLCWKLNRAGYTIYVEPKSVIYHLGGGTLNKTSPRKTYLNFRNNLSTLTKNHASTLLFPKIIYRMILDGVAGIVFITEGKPKHCLAVLHAHFSYYAWLPALLKKRKALRKHPKFRDATSCIYPKNIVYLYFIKGLRLFSQLPWS